MREGKGRERKAEKGRGRKGKGEEERRNEGRGRKSYPHFLDESYAPENSFVNRWSNGLTTTSIAFYV